MLVDTQNSSAISSYLAQFESKQLLTKKIHELGIEKCQKILDDLGETIKNPTELQWSEVQIAFLDERQKHVINTLTVIGEVFQIGDEAIIDSNNQLLDKIRRTPSFEAALMRNNVNDKKIKTIVDRMKNVTKCFLELNRGIDYQKNALDKLHVEGRVKEENHIAFKEPLIAFQKFYTENSDKIRQIYEEHESIKETTTEWKRCIFEKTLLKNKIEVTPGFIKLMALAFGTSRSYMEIAASTFQLFFLDIPKSIAKLDTGKNEMENTIKEFRKNYNYLAYCCATDQSPSWNTAWLAFFSEFHGVYKRHRFMYAPLQFVNGHLSLIENQVPNRNKQIFVSLKNFNQDAYEIPESASKPDFQIETLSHFKILRKIGYEDVFHITEIFKCAASRFNVQSDLILDGVLGKKIKEIPSNYKAEKQDAALINIIKDIRQMNAENLNDLLKAYANLKKQEGFLNGELHFSTFQNVLLSLQSEYNTAMILFNDAILRINVLLEETDNRFTKEECNLSLLFNSFVNSDFPKMNDNLNAFIKSLPNSVDNLIKSLFEFALDFEPGSLEETLIRCRDNAEMISKDLKLLFKEVQGLFAEITKYKSAYNFFAYCCAEDIRPKNYSSWTGGYKEKENDYADSLLKFRDDGHLVPYESQAIDPLDNLTDFEADHGEGRRL